MLAALHEHLTAHIRVLLTTGTNLGVEWPSATSLGLCGFSGYSGFFPPTKDMHSIRLISDFKQTIGVYGCLSLCVYSAPFF